MVPAGLLPPRLREVHKGSAGRLFLLAGSEGLSGAAALCAMGALRTGAGLVTLGIPKRLHDPMAKKLTEAMLKVLPETEQGSLALSGLAQILKAVEQNDVIAIGPGLSQNAETQELVRQLVLKISRPMVIDADGLNALSGHLPVLGKHRAATVITPHPGEMSRLTGLPVEVIQKKREAIAKEFSREHRVVVVLKGSGTVVANISGECYVNETGNSGMATGGCGDVLTGMIAALTGQKFSLWDAARFGVFFHGLAGDLAAKKIGHISVTASDLAEFLPAAFKKILKF